MVSGKVVIGSLQGNTYGLGKGIVAQALKSAGFHVIDLGVNVSPKAFVESAIREKAQVIAISVSASETVPYIKEVVDLLREKGLHKTVKTVIGGGAVSEEIREKLGVGAYAKDALDCVNKVKALLDV